MEVAVPVPAVPCEAPRLPTRALAALAGRERVSAWCSARFRSWCRCEGGITNPTAHKTSCLTINGLYSPIQPPADKTLNYTGCHRVSKNDNPKCDSQHGTRAAKPSAHTITWLEAQHDPKRVPRARLVTNVPCRPGARARGTPIGVPAARQHAQSARSYPLLMRHRKASPTAPVRNSCNE